MFIDVYSNPESNRKGVLHYFSRIIHCTFSDSFRGYYNWSKQQKGESSNQHGDFINNHVQRRGFQQPSKHGWSDQETWVIWFTNMAEFEPNQTGKNTQLQQQTLKFQAVKADDLINWQKAHHPGEAGQVPSKKCTWQSKVSNNGLRPQKMGLESAWIKCLEHIGTAAIALCFLVHLYNLLLWLCNPVERRQAWIGFLTIKNLQHNTNKQH